MVGRWYASFTGRGGPKAWLWRRLASFQGCRGCERCPNVASSSVIVSGELSLLLMHEELAGVVVPTVLRVVRCIVLLFQRVAAIR